MPCNPLTSTACIVKIGVGALPVPGNPVAGEGLADGVTAGAKAAASGISNSVLGGLAGAIQDAIVTITKESVAWWISLPSPDVVGDPVVHTLQAWLAPFTAAVAVLSIITAGGRMALTRKVTPLAEVGSGLLTLAVVVAVGALLPTLLMRAGDAYSTFVLNAATGGQFASRMTALVAIAGVGGPAAVGLLIVLGILGLIAATVQAILLVFRQGAVIILTGTLPLAAAGQMTALTRPWLRKVTGWMLALIAYKPAAATVYAVGFLMIGKGKAEEVFVGFAILLLSLVTLPALMRFFTWPTGALETSSAGGGFLGAVIGGAAAVGAIRAYGPMSAGDQATAMRAVGAAGPADGGPGGGGGPDSGGPSGGGPSGGGPAGGGPAGPAASGGGAAGGGGPAGGGPSGGAGANPAAPAGATAGPGPAGGSAAGTETATAGAAGAGAPAGATAAAGPSAAGAVAPAAGAATAAAGPAGMIVLGAGQAAQAAHGAAARLADGAAPPGNTS